MITSESQKSPARSLPMYNLSLPVSERRLLLIFGDTLLLALVVLLAIVLQSLL